jgi:hypothetical protein
MVNRRERGKDGALSVGGTQVPITNASFSASYEISTNDWNDNFNPYKSMISGEASGSFEWAGSVPPARDSLINPDGTPRLGVALQIRLDEETFRATRVLVGEYERNLPSDSNTDGSVNWESGSFRFVR